jgi:hypothetical protein
MARRLPIAAAKAVQIRYSFADDHSRTFGSDFSERETAPDGESLAA